MMIFEDPSRKRWRFALLIATCLAVASAVSLYSVVNAARSDAVLAQIPAQLDAIDASNAFSLPLRGEDEFREAPTTKPHGPRYPQPIASAGPVTSTFIIQNDTQSLSRLADIGPRLDIVFPDYFAFWTPDGAIHSTIRPLARDQFDAIGACLIPRISNTDPDGNWNAKAFSAILRDPIVQLEFLDTLLTRLKACDANGVNIDIEGLTPADSRLFVQFLDELAGALHWYDMYLTVDVPVADSAYDYEAIADIADAVVLMAYDQYFAASKPGPIAGADWFREAVSDLASRIPPEKLIVALGAYGYDWRGASPAQSISFLDFLDIQSSSHAHATSDPASMNTTLVYTDPRGARHTVFMLDAVTAWNQFAFLSDPALVGASGKHLAGTSVWRLGLEDPAIWTFLLSRNPSDFNPATLSSIAPQEIVEVHGDGQFFRIKSTQTDGERSLSIDGRFIDDAKYVSVPTSYHVDRAGATPAKLIALTFDDGPDPTWTPRLLDILKRESVQATFFVVGDLVDRSPLLAHRIVAEGHLIGNHTFSHPRPASLTPTQFAVELNRAERSIEAATNRQTLLFRSPFDIDSIPQSPDQLDPLSVVSRLGYICVGADINAADYLKRPADVMVDLLLPQLTAPHTGGHVICFHDGGGDRSQTLLAVEKLIPALRERGYSIVGLEQFAHVPASDLNPIIPPTEASAASSARSAAWIRTTGWSIISTIFIASTIVALIRISSLGVIVLLQHRDTRRQRSLPASAAFSDPITVVVPAYNEAKVIERTISAILASDYPAINILVIDDGSVDDTAAIVSAIAHTDPRVRVITKPNAGKSHALNLGFRKATTDIVVILDADTIVLPTTLSALVAPFARPEVDAVCGNVQVGNVRNLLTRLQDVEYVTCQNYDRRAFDRLNCIGVVPGATGAWRRQTVIDAGGYSSDTLTEGADLTLEVLRRGGRIVYAPDARSITEAPETVRALYRQRFRWSFGTFQTLWKHRAAFGHGSLGWVGMTNLLIFQLVFPMLAPIGDAVLVLSLLAGDWNALVSGYLMFLGMDVLGSAVAFKLDHRPIRGIWTVFIQRFCYRQFMYVVTFSAAVAALRGRRHGWNKLERLASVLSPTDMLEVITTTRGASVQHLAVPEE